MRDFNIKFNADHYDGYWMPLGKGVPPVGNALIVTIWDSIRNRRELRYPVMYRKSWTSDTYGFYVLGDENEWLNPEYDRVLAWTLFPEIWEGEEDENTGRNQSL